MKDKVQQALFYEFNINHNVTIFNKKKNRKLVNPIRTYT